MIRVIGVIKVIGGFKGIRFSKNCRVIRVDSQLGGKLGQIRVARIRVGLSSGYLRLSSGYLRVIFGF